MNLLLFNNNPNTYLNPNPNQLHQCLSVPLSLSLSGPIALLMNLLLSNCSRSPTPLGIVVKYFRVRKGMPARVRPRKSFPSNGLGADEKTFPAGRWLTPPLASTAHLLSRLLSPLFSPVYLSVLDAVRGKYGAADDNHKAVFWHQFDPFDTLF